MSDAEFGRYPIERLRTQAEAILRGWGLDDEDALLTADVLTDADLRGIDTHGVSLLDLYDRWITAGKLQVSAGKARIEREGPSHALLDARGGLGFAVSVRAAELAAKKARETGIAAVTVRNSHHFGATGYYARLAANAGALAVVATSSKVVCVVPSGAATAVLGTNPIAYGVPRRGGEPIVFDIATSTVAGNRVRMHHVSDTPLPEGWVVDGRGKPVTDPHEAFRLVYEEGAGGLTPVGGHKGYGLSLLVHFLAGTLPGAMFPATGRPGSGNGDNVGHFFLAIDPGVYRAFDTFLDDVDEVVATLRDAPAADPKRPVLVPGDIEARNRAERLVRGVPLAPAVVDRIRAIAASLGVDDLLG